MYYSITAIERRKFYFQTTTIIFSFQDVGFNKRFKRSMYVFSANRLRATIIT